MSWTAVAIVVAYPVVAFVFYHLGRYGGWKHGCEAGYKAQKEDAQRKAETSYERGYNDGWKRAFVDNSDSVISHRSH